MSLAITSITRRREFFRRRFCASPAGIAWMFALLTGCASIVSAPLSPAPPSSTANFFSLEGRISVRVGEKIEAGRVIWTKRPHEERIALFTPLGGQVAELVDLKSGQVTMRRAGTNETEMAASFEALTLAVLGVALDLEEVARWTQGVGLGDDAAAARTFSSGASWQVTASRLQTCGPHQFASRMTAIRGDTVVKLVIDDWRAE